MSIISKKLKVLPYSPGVYIFKDKTGAVLYVGKAMSLKDRVGSYFDLTPSPSPSKGEGGGLRPIEIKISKVEDFEIRKTDTVIEAYILEQKLIKDLQPKYNVDGKDDRSFCYVLVTKEDFPNFIVLRATELAKLRVIASEAKQSRKKRCKLSKKEIAAVGYLPARFDSARRAGRQALPRNDAKFTKIYGPYTSRRTIEMALKILRKIFPYHSMKQKTEKGCLDYQLGRCPGPYAGTISKEDYRKNIRGIRMILEGKKKNLIYRMKKEMNESAKKHEYEKAAEIRNKIFSLEHIQDMALIANPSPALPLVRGRENSSPALPFKKGGGGGGVRIEGYDISNISGKYCVGSMAVFDNLEGELKPNKSQYRKFKIKTIKGANDIGAMREMLLRRFKNNWAKPNLIILDGGKGHLNMARSVLRIYRLDIPILAVAKGPDRKKLDLYSFGTLPKMENLIVEKMRDEAHRFAISYHKKLREKSFKEECA